MKLIADRLFSHPGKRAGLKIPSNQQRGNTLYKISFWPLSLSSSMSAQTGYTRAEQTCSTTALLNLLTKPCSQTHTHILTKLMELAMSQVPVMVNAALFSSDVKLIFRFQVPQLWQQADPPLTSGVRRRKWEREREKDTIQHNLLLIPSLTHSVLLVLPLVSLSSSNECWTSSFYFSFSHLFWCFVSLLIILPVSSSVILSF